MKKIDIIKFMEQELEAKENELANTESERVIKNVYKFYDEYIHPRLTKLNKQDIIIYDRGSTDKDISKHSNDIYTFAIHTIEMIGRMNELNDCNILHLMGDSNKIMLDDYYIISMIEEQEIFNNKECNVLTTTDKEYKSMVANSIIEMIITREHIKLILKFYNKYVAPMLNQFNDNKKIVFNIDSNDDDIKQVSLKVKDVMLGYLMCCYMETRKYQDTQENEIPQFIIYIMACFFDIDEHISKDMASTLCDNIASIFNMNDFLKLNVDDIISQLYNNDKLKEC